MPSQKTLRDEFAMAAMTGDWASSLGRFDEDIDSDHLRERARLYYRMADVMCEVRHENAKKARRLFPFLKPPERTK